MANAKTYTIRFKRRRLGKTNYNRRLTLLKSRRARIVIRRSLNNIIIQLVEYDSHGDLVKVTVNSLELKKLGWKFNTGNLVSAYLTGLLFSKTLREKNLKSGILDIGVQTSVPGSRIYSALKGITDGGIDIDKSDDILPSTDRISGKHIADYAIKLKKEDVEKYNVRFSNYIKNNLDPTKIHEEFNIIKEQLQTK